MPSLNSKVNIGFGFPALCFQVWFLKIGMVTNESVCARLFSAWFMLAEFNLCFPCVLIGLASILENYEFDTCFGNNSFILYDLLSTL